MSTYVVIRKADGQEVYRYDGDAPIDWDAWPFATHDHAAEAAPVPVPAPVYGGRRELEVLEFMRLFTTEERIAIRSAAAQSTVASDYLDLMYRARMVRLDDPDTITAVNMFEQAGLLTSGRAAEVLNG